MLTLYVPGGDLRHPLSLVLNRFGRIDELVSYMVYLLLNEWGVETLLRTCKTHKLCYRRFQVKTEDIAKLKTEPITAPATPASHQT